VTLNYTEITSNFNKMCEKKRIKYKKLLKKIFIKIRDLILKMKIKAYSFNHSETLDHFVIHFLDDNNKREKIID